jgi:hypothetical protein
MSRFLGFVGLGILASGLAVAGTISGSVTGSGSPVTDNFPNVVVNGGFTIAATAPSVVGDGIDDETTWTIDFNGHPNFGSFNTAIPLTLATLNLTLHPVSTGTGQQGITDDRVGIPPGNLYINTPAITGLPVGVTSPVSLDLLSFFTSAEILAVFTANNGTIPMVYGDDAIVSFAEVTLSNEVVPEPSTWLLLSAGMGVIVAVGRRRRAGP